MRWHQIGNAMKQIHLREPSSGYAQQRCLKGLLQWSIQKGNTVTLTCCNLHGQSFQRSCFSPFVLTITECFCKVGWDLQLIWAVHIQYLSTNNLKEITIKTKPLNSALPAYLAIHVICIHLNFKKRYFIFECNHISGRAIFSLKHCWRHLPERKPSLHLPKQLMMKAWMTAWLGPIRCTRSQHQPLPWRSRRVDHPCIQCRSGTRKNPLEHPISRGQSNSADALQKSRRLDDRLKRKTRSSNHCATKSHYLKAKRPPESELCTRSEA